MTREQLIKHWDAIVAFKKGDNIQEWKDYTNITMGGWSYDLRDPKFDLDKTYRVVPRRFDYDYSTPNFLAGLVAVVINSLILLLIYYLTKDEVMFFFMFVGGGVLFIIFMAFYPKKIYRK